MRLLLDTHIWLWSLDDPDRLSNRVRTALRSADNEVWLSPVSVWEVLLLAEKGRIGLKPEPTDWVQKALEKSGAREATLNHHIAIRSRQVELDHEDPADRFLAATAQVYDLTLVTADEGLLRGRGYQALSNIERGSAAGGP